MLRAFLRVDIYRLMAIHDVRNYGRVQAFRIGGREARVR